MELHTYLTNKMDFPFLLFFKSGKASPPPQKKIRAFFRQKKENVCWVQVLFLCVYCLFIYLLLDPVMLFG